MEHQWLFDNRRYRVNTKSILEIIAFIYPLTKE